MTHSIVVLSGGLDSAVALWLTATYTTRITAITVDYGQRHHREIEAARDVVIALRRRTKRPAPTIDHHLVNVPDIGRALTGSALTDQSVPVPHGHYTAPVMASTVVPNRNMILAAIATGIAVSRGADEMVLAVHAGDHPVYPDCRPVFVDALQRCVTVGTDSALRVVVPFVHETKSKIVEVGHRLGVPFELTWSCYEGRDTHCGRCGTCAERKEAFELARVPDPTIYRHHPEETTDVHHR